MRAEDYFLIVIIFELHWKRKLQKIVVGLMQNEIKVITEVLTVFWNSNLRTLNMNWTKMNFWITEQKFLFTQIKFIKIALIKHLSNEISSLFTVHYVTQTFCDSFMQINCFNLLIFYGCNQTSSKTSKIILSLLFTR